MRRFFINQPSTLQLLHHWHGARVLAEDNDTQMVTVYFTSGDVTSARVPRHTLSYGWLKHNKEMDN